MRFQEETALSRNGKAEGHSERVGREIPQPLCILEPSPSHQPLTLLNPSSSPGPLWKQTIWLRAYLHIVWASTS